MKYETKENHTRMSIDESFKNALRMLELSFKLDRADMIYSNARRVARYAIDYLDMKEFLENKEN